MKTYKNESIAKKVATKWAAEQDKTFTVTEMTDGTFAVHEEGVDPNGADTTDEPDVTEQVPDFTQGTPATVEATTGVTATPALDKLKLCSMFFPEARETAKYVIVDHHVGDKKKRPRWFEKNRMHSWEVCEANGKKGIRIVMTRVNLTTRGFKTEGLEWEPSEETHDTQTEADMNAMQATDTAQVDGEIASENAHHAQLEADAEQAAA